MDETTIDQNATVEAEKPNNTLGIVSLVAGIVGILTVCCGPIPILLGIAAVICGIMARKQDQQFALPGIILGAVSIVIGLIVFLGGITLPFIAEMF